ncbi:UDP-N-acetylmuramate--L-alanine ligase [Parenemella sanctibonifatiensis]|uniref:UDP-N-acetylmuramate--L-alanine ligase n=1 Tax=Parenemella sanctibonifatiensis TaxID=2016505 RepID=A0A255EJN4_9ACTN|nr:UDP-N-acetylmuramate--L-alanine ligase [Parenemella sanctibonifatiensis]OYN89835.1 UDP-N-acetylmuramate--L-alanine ligase [Parenemella sanctibonifatiensis]
MALQQPPAPSDPRAAGPFHFIAIGGSSMSGIAELYADLGLAVTGSDRSDSAALQRVRDRGIRAYVGHAAEQLGAARTVVVSSAIRESNPELAAARERGLQVWHRSTALAALTLGRRTVAVSGTHGKTSTTGMIAALLRSDAARRGGPRPGYALGATLAGAGRAADVGDATAPFVVEADESDGSFLVFQSEIAVITNIEADHLDNWGTPQAYRQGFLDFATAAGHVILCSDDPGTAALAGRLRQLDPEQVTSYGTSAEADERLFDAHVVDGRWQADWPSMGVVLRAPAPGHHSLLNAQAAVLSAVRLGIPAADAVAALADFAGTSRRYEAIGEVADVRIVDDYAHHPTEVAATLTAARAEVGPTGRVLAIFQPHLYSRTRDFAKDFARVLELADRAWVLDVYAAREDPDPSVTGATIADLADDRVRFEPDSNQALADLVAAVEPGVPTVVLTVGAGDVTALAPLLRDALQRWSGGGPHA